MDRERLPSRSSSAREMEVLPAPDGDDSTSMRPRRRMSGPPFVPSVTPSSLDVLDLLAEPLDGRLHGEADPGQLHVGRIRTMRNGFTVHSMAGETQRKSVV